MTFRRKLGGSITRRNFIHKRRHYAKGHRWRECHSNSLTFLTGDENCHEKFVIHVNSQRTARKSLKKCGKLIRKCLTFQKPHEATSNFSLRRNDQLKHVWRVSLRKGSTTRWVEFMSRIAMFSTKIRNRSRGDSRFRNESITAYCWLIVTRQLQDPKL